METELEKPKAVEIEEAKKKLAALKGSMKGKLLMDPEQAREEAGREAFAKFGIELD